MNKDELDRLSAIQSEQLLALSEQRIDDMQQLETEKTALLQKLLEIKVLSVPQREQLEAILQQQHHLEALCVEIRDALREQVKLQLQKDKAVRAYEKGGL